MNWTITSDCGFHTTGWWRWARFRWKVHARRCHTCAPCLKGAL